MGETYQSLEELPGVVDIPISLTMAPEVWLFSIFRAMYASHNQGMNAMNKMSTVIPSRFKTKTLLIARLPVLEKNYAHWPQ